MNYNPSPGSSWNPRTIQDVLNAIGTHLGSVKSIFAEDENESNRVKFVEMYDNYKKAFDVISQYYPPIKVPKGTLIFHSNKFFGVDQNMYEPLGTKMKIQDIRRYTNKSKDDNDIYYPMSETASRIYCNFTPAANQYVKGNLNVSESVYVTDEDLTFFQLPVLSTGHHLKDLLQLTSTILFRNYILEKNNNPEKIKYCGFILSTNVDSAKLLDPNTLYFEYRNHAGETEYVYPEILLMDGFSKLTKVGQYDIYEDLALDLDLSMDQYQALESLESGDFHIKRIDINQQLKEIHETFSLERINIGNYGTLPLMVYKANKLDTFWTRDYSDDDDL